MYSCKVGEIQSLISYGLIPNTTEGKDEAFCGEDAERPEGVEYCTKNFFSSNFADLFTQHCVGQQTCDYGFHFSKLVQFNSAKNATDKTCV